MPAVRGGCFCLGRVFDAHVGVWRLLQGQEQTNKTDPLRPLNHRDLRADAVFSHADLIRLTGQICSRRTLHSPENIPAHKEVDTQHVRPKSRIIAGTRNTRYCFSTLVH